MISLFQCRLIKEKLNLANRFTVNDIFEFVSLTRYISVPIALRYGSLGPNISSSISHGLNEPFSGSND